MKFPVHSFTLLTTAALVLPGSAGLIYSNLQDISIPANFDGVYLNVETGAFNNDSMAPVAGWDVNPFFGGSAIWNAPAFQPVRAGTTGSSAVLNLATGTIVDGSSVFSTAVQGPGGETPGGPAYGASDTHMGAGAGQFQNGQEGYFGFKLNGTNYGWMRVVFDSTGTGLIKDWAYDDSGAQIAVGNITNTGNVVTADSTSGNFTVGSIITNALATTSFVKTGSGTVTLTAGNTFTGTASVNQGTLVLDHNNGALVDTVAVVVASGATLALNNHNQTIGSLAGVAGSSVDLANKRLVIGANNADTTFAGVISQSGGGAELHKTGTGTLTLTGANTYTGHTEVLGGKLAVNGSLASALITVKNGATLEGTGSMISTGTLKIEANSTLAAGGVVTIESLASGNLELLADAVFAFDMDKNAAPSAAADLMAVTGNFTLATDNQSILSLSELGGPTGEWTIGEKLTLLSYSGTWNGGLFEYGGNAVANNSTISFSGMDWLFQYNDSVAGSNFATDLTGSSYVTMTAIPETSVTLLGSLASLLLLRRRREN